MLSADELYKIDKTAMGDVLSGSSSRPVTVDDQEDAESLAQPENLSQEDPIELDDVLKAASDDVLKDTSNEPAKEDQDIDKDVAVGN